MSINTRARGVLAPLAMTVATAAFLFAGAPAPAFAQTSTHATPAAAAMRAGSVDQRIAQLHRELKISANQEQQWSAVADVMKSNAENMKNLMGQAHAEGPKAQRTALEDLQNYAKFARAHADNLDRLTSAFGTLYDSMSPDQKANADRVFRSFEQHRPSRG